MKVNFIAVKLGKNIVDNEVKFCWILLLCIWHLDWGEGFKQIMGLSKKNKQQ